MFFKITFKIFKSPASLHDNKSQLLTIVPSRKGGGGDSGGLTNNMLRNFSLSPSLSKKHNIFSLESELEDTALLFQNLAIGPEGVSSFQGWCSLSFTL